MLDKDKADVTISYSYISDNGTIDNEIHIEEVPIDIIRDALSLMRENANRT